MKLEERKKNKNKGSLRKKNDQHFQALQNDQSCTHITPIDIESKPMKKKKSQIV